MAVAGTLLVANFSTSVTNSFNTASIAPTGSYLVLASILSHDAADAVAPTVTLSGNGITWVSAIRRTNGAVSLTTFRGMVASPSSGAVTMSVDRNTDNTSWIISQYSGIDTSGSNGANAVRNPTGNDASSVSSLTVTLPAFSSANNGTYGAFSGGAGSTFSVTPGSGFTELAENTVNLGGVYFVREQAQWRATNDTSVDASISVTADAMIGNALEIVAAAAGATTNLRAGKLIRGGILHQGLR